MIAVVDDEDDNELSEKESDHRKRRVARLILSHLVRNPAATDTVEGILQWWLLHEEIHFRMQEVEATLSELAVRGMVTPVVGEDLRIRYRINPEKQEEIRVELCRMEE